MNSGPPKPAASQVQIQQKQLLKKVCHENTKNFAKMEYISNANGNVYANWRLEMTK